MPNNVSKPGEEPDFKVLLWVDVKPFVIQTAVQQLGDNKKGPSRRWDNLKFVDKDTAELTDVCSDGKCPA